MFCPKHGEQATICRFCDAETIAKSEGSDFLIDWPESFDSICQTVFESLNVITVRTHSEDETDRWIEREKRAHPRAALFLDGRCIHKGVLTDAQIYQLTRTI